MFADGRPLTVANVYYQYPGNNSCDEWFFADLINRSCGCTGNQILPDAEDIEKRFENLVWHVEGSCGLSLLGSKFLLDEINRRGYKVILNGQCGDELMLGYERLLCILFRIPDQEKAVEDSGVRISSGQSPFQIICERSGRLCALL